MSRVIGEADIIVGADARSFESSISSSASAAGKSITDKIGGALSGLGKSMERVGGELTKKITVPAAGAATAAGGIVAALGWGRLTDIDAAQAQLRGLGYEAEDVQRISDQLVRDLEGGMMTLGDATSAAAAAMAAGVQEGDELTRYIQILDAAAVGSTASVDEMAQSFARITDMGYLTGREFASIANRMPGFSSAMREHLGVSSEAMYDMLRDGQITSADFLDVMEGFAGDMATSYAQSWDGMVANTKNYIGILGQNLLGGVFEQSKESIAEFIEFLSSDEVAEWAEETGEKIGAAFSEILTWVQDAISWFKDLNPTVQNAALVIGGIAVAAGPTLLILGKLLGLVTPLIAVFRTMRAVVLGVQAAKAGLAATTMLATGATTAQTVAAKAGAAAQRLFNAAMRANPIGLVITAITALVAALVWFFTKTETGQKIVTAVWEAIKSAIGAVVDWFQNTALPIIQSVWDGIVTGFEWVRDALTTAWEAVKTGFQAVGDFFRAAYDTLIQPVIDAFVAAGNWLRDNVLPPLQAIWEAFQAVGQFFWDVYYGTIQLVFDVFAYAVEWLWDNGIKPIFDAIKDAWGAVASFFSDRSDDVQKTWDGLSKALKKVWNWIDKNVFGLFRRALDGWKNFFADRAKDAENIWDGLKNALKAIWDWIDRNVFGLFRSGLDAWKNFFSDRIANVRSLWDSLKAPMEAVWNWIDRNVLSKFREGFERMEGWVRTGVENIGNLWRRVANFFREPINGVINFVWNDGLKAAFDAVADAVGSSASLPAIPTIPAFASGGRMGSGWKLVGEEGPELIRTGPGWVHDAEKTKRLLASANNPLQKQFSSDNPPHGGLGQWLGDRWSDAKNVVTATGRVLRDAAGNVVQWARGGLAKAAEFVLNPIFNSLSSITSRFGPMGQLGGDTMVRAKDLLVEWIRGEDEKANVPPESSSSLRGARPYVNNAAFALANMVGGIRTMQAFNQSMAGGHPEGRAVDFIDSRSKLDSLAQAIIRVGGYDRFSYLAWQGRLWSPGRGWRPQGRGFGNDPMHRWHLHAEWFDKGGLLKKGWNVVYNGTGTDEQVANITSLVQQLRRGALDVRVPEMAQRQAQSPLERMRDGEVRLSKTDLDYLADRLASKLWPMARAADHVNDFASMGRTRRRMGGV